MLYDEIINMCRHWCYPLGYMVSPKSVEKNKWLNLAVSFILFVFGLTHLLLDESCTRSSSMLCSHVASFSRGVADQLMNEHFFYFLDLDSRVAVPAPRPERTPRVRVPQQSQGLGISPSSQAHPLPETPPLGCILCLPKCYCCEFSIFVSCLYMSRPQSGLTIQGMDVTPWYTCATHGRI
jgi:hypothetical protein